MARTASPPQAPPDGLRTFIVTTAASLAMLSTLGLVTTMSEAARPLPVVAEQTPPGVRDAVIIPRDQYELADAAPAPVSAPVAVAAQTEHVRFVRKLRPAPIEAPVQLAMAITPVTITPVKSAQ